MLTRVTGRVGLGPISWPCPAGGGVFAQPARRHRVEELFFIRVHADFTRSSGRAPQSRAIPKWSLASVILRDRLFVAFLPQRADGEEFIAAGHAAERGNPQDSRKERRLTRDMPGRYALQVQIAADAAVGKEQAAKRNATGAKPGFAGCTAPGKNSAHGQQVINDGAAVRTPEFGAATGWANEFGLNLRSPENTGPGAR